MHLEAMIKQVCRCTWRLWSNEFPDALGGRHWRSLEIHLEAVIRGVCRCTWRLWSSEIRGVLAHGQSGGGNSGGRCDGSWDSIYWLTCNCGNVDNWVQHGVRRDERLAESGRQSMSGCCCTWCMLYSVYAILGECRTRCMLYSVNAVLGVCCTRCMLYSVLTIDHGMER